MSDSHVPLLDLKAQYAGIKDEIGAAIERVLESQHFVMGPEVLGLEAEIAVYCGSAFAVACGSGSDALFLSLMALDVGPGDQVICPTYTFIATGGAIARLGAVPVFADIDPESFNVTVETIRAAAVKCDRLKAIMPVHLYGQAAPVDEILALADELGVPVIEDAAQAIGSRGSRGCRVGSQSPLSCFSFFPSKNLGGYGDGGIITTQDEALAERIRILRVHGGRPKYYHAEVGVNSRLDSLQAAILRVKLDHLDSWSEGRRRNAALYQELFAKAGGGQGSGNFDSLTLPVHTPVIANAPAEHIFNQFVIRVPAEKRDDLRRYMQENNVGSEIYYPVPLHMQECFSKLGYQRGDLPESERAARETIALPIYPELTREQLEIVVATIQTFLATELRS